MNNKYLQVKSVVKRALFCSLTIVASISFTLTSANYINDNLNIPAIVNVGETSMMIEESYMSGRLNNTETAAESSFVNQSFIIQEFNLGVANTEEPHVVSIDVYPEWVVFGNTVTVDLTLNEEIRTFTATIGGITPDMKYHSRHCYLLYNPVQIMDGMLSANIALVDSGGNIAKSVVTFGIVVDSGQDKLDVAAIETDMYDEVHIGKKDAHAIAFNVKATEKLNTFKSLNVSVNVAGGSFPFEKFALYNADNNTLIAENLAPSTNMDLIISGNEEIGFSAANYYLTYDLMDGVSSGISFRVNLNTITSRKVTGDSKDYITTTNIANKGTKIITVAKDKPIIIKSALHEFVGSSTQLAPVIQHEIAQGTVRSFKYRIKNVTDGTYTNWREITYEGESLDVSTQYQMINSTISNLDLEHNKSYYIEMQMVGPVDGSIVSSNEFLVDLTIPERPDAIEIQPVYSAGLKAEADVVVPVRLILDTAQSHDTESGITTYKILRKTADEPEWQLAVTGNVGTANTVSTTLDEDVNQLYSYKYSIRNDAANWSEYSDSNDLDLRINVDLIDVFFNSPNPFDSRLDQTTIYYTLRESSDVKLYIYDMWGYLVKKWEFSAGSIGGEKNNEIKWDGTNENGDPSSTGGYIVVLQATSGTTGEKYTKKQKIGLIH